MLELNPEKRITADEILNHPWISEPTEYVFYLYLYIFL